MEDAFSDFIWTYQTILCQVGVNALLALSMYCVLATGQLFLGQMGFMAIGAYCGAMLTTTLGFPLWLAMLAGTALSAAVAVALVYPMLRLAGVYMAIGTIAFGEVVRSLVVNVDGLGGPLGLSGIPESLSIPALYGMVAVLTAFLIGIMYSRIGRSVEAVRTDELAAQAMGINVHAVKLASVLMSAGIAGLAGVASAHSMGTIAPSEFSFAGSVTVLGFVILGGVASPLGALLGVVILTLLPQLLSGFSESRAMINGLAIVFVVMLFPSGLFPFKVIRIRGSAQRQ